MVQLRKRCWCRAESAAGLCIKRVLAASDGGLTGSGSRGSAGRTSWAFKLGNRELTDFRFLHSAAEARDWEASPPFGSIQVFGFDKPLDQSPFFTEPPLGGQQSGEEDEEDRPVDVGRAQLPALGDHGFQIGRAHV